jgi:predicted dehydrogenase
VHAPALAATAGIDLTAVWGRNPGAAAALAGSYGCAWFSNFDAFIAEVDAVAFAVPPDVQASLAAKAAVAGRHLLLEKPIAVSDRAADALVGAVEDANVASVVFFTARFQADVRAWLDLVSARAWAGGAAVWLGSALVADSPFNTPWRRDNGGLWDLAPQLVSLLWASLGPVRAVIADAGAGGGAGRGPYRTGGEHQVRPDAARLRRVLRARRSRDLVGGAGADRRSAR